MMKLLALVLLLCVFSSLTLAEVVEDFEKSGCSKLFIQSPKMKKTITPTVLKGYQYKRICQRWSNIYRFATLYDTVQRIPVYSAYRFTGGEDGPRDVWKNEPQLENIQLSPDMELISDYKMDEFFHQAVNRDYEESRRKTGAEYTRGHVFPNQYAADEDQKASSFTFTNVAPQTQHSNGEWEREVETPMRREIMRECKPDKRNPTYIVTGVVPGNKWIPITRKRNNKPERIEKGVNIPSYYWAAFCCYISDTETTSGAYLALQNEPNDRTYDLSRMSADRLNTRLTKLYNQDFTVFGQLCLN